MCYITKETTKGYTPKISCQKGLDLAYRKRSILGIVQIVQPEDAYFLG